METAPHTRCSRAGEEDQREAVELEVWSKVNALPQHFEPSIGTKEAAHMLGVSVQTVKNYVHAGEIPHMRIGTRILFLPSILDQWRRERIVKSSTPCVAARKEKK